jgi:outer membrane protein assembly factor BamA
VVRRQFCFPVLLLLCAVAVAQTAEKAKKRYQLLSIHVKGLEQHTEDQIVAASGLKLGQFAGEEEFQQAAQRLGETGLFTQLTYKYRYSSAGCNLELEVAENKKLVAVGFENFVWFSDDELFRLLHERLPLFDGRLPKAGSLPHQVSEALSSILDQHKIPGNVEYLASGPPDEPIGYDYEVSMHTIVIRNVDFPGAGADEIPELAAAAKSLAGEDYLRTKMRAHEQADFLPLYRARGYLKAEFGDIKARVAEDGARTLVDVSFPVNPGRQYELTDLQFSGNTVFRTEKLRELLHLTPGTPANAVELASDLEEVHKLYGTKGYLYAHVDAVPNIDDIKRTVSYQLNVIEDEIYHMGELTIDGIPEENARKMARQWQMKRGDPYDSSYLQRFFALLYRDFALPRSYNLVPKQAINRQDKTVSVSLHFVPQA